MVPLAAQAVIIVLGDAAVRVRAAPGRRAASASLLLAVFGVGLGSLSYALAIAVRKQEWMFWAVQQTLLFPLMILSGMLLPLETGPGWMRAASTFNPLTYLVDAERAPVRGRRSATAAALGLAGRPGDRGGRAPVGIRSMRAPLRLTARPPGTRATRPPL